MFEPKLPASVDDIHLDQIEFWNAPAEEREGAFELLRRERPIAFTEEFGHLLCGIGTSRRFGHLYKLFCTSWIGLKIGPCSLVFVFWCAPSGDH